MLSHDVLNCSGNHFGVGPKVVFETYTQCSLQWKNCKINDGFLSASGFFLFDLTVRSVLGPSLHGRNNME